MTAKKRGRPKNPNTVTRVSAREVLIQLEKHESLCATRLDAIEKRLEDGSKKFIRLEQYIWGLYAAIFVTAIAGKLF